MNYRVTVADDQQPTRFDKTFSDYDTAKMVYDSFRDFAFAIEERVVTLSDGPNVLARKTFDGPKRTASKIIKEWREAPVYKCPNCGSTRLLQDAYVAVNDPTDVRIFDAIDCDSCGCKDITPEEAP